MPLAVRLALFVPIRVRPHAERAPVRRNGRPEDVAQMIAALVENGFVSGAVVPCDGGLRLT